MAAKLTPLGNRVVAKQLESKEQTASGFYLPQDAKDKPDIAEVVAIGNDVKGLKKGDKVVYKTYNSPVKIDGEELLILATDTAEKEGDILAILG